MKKILITLFLLSLALTNTAQMPYHRVYDGRFGLPSSEVYSITQDEQGYIWFATDHGLARFDGYQFRTYDIQNGLPENSVFYFKKDTRGRTWFNTYDGKLGFLDHGKLFPYRYNKELEAYMGLKSMSNFAVFHSYKVDKHDKAHFYLQKVGYFTIDSSGNVSDYENIVRRKVLTIEFDETGDPFFYGPENLIFDTVEIQDGPEHFKADINIMKSVKRSPKNLSAIRSNESYYLGFQQMVIKLTNKKVSHTFQCPHYIISIDQDRQGNIWVMTLNGGVYYLNDQLEEINHYFSGESFSDFLQDHEGGIWLTSINKGVIYIPDLHHIVVEFEDNTLKNDQITDITIDWNGNQWMTFFSGKIGHQQSNGIKLFDLQLGLREFIVKILADPYRKVIWIATDRRLVYIKNEKVINYQFKKVKFPDTVIPAIKSFTLDKKDSTLWIGLFSGLTNIRSNEETDVLSYYQGSFHERVESIESAENGDVWAGTTRGLHRLRKGEITRVGSQHKAMLGRITALKSFGDSLWIGTRGNGLLLFVHDSLFQFTMENGLPSNSVRVIESIDNCLIIGTNNGLFLASRQLQNGQLSILRQFGGTELISKEIIQILPDKNLTTILSKAGLSTIKNITKSSESYHMPILIRNVMIKNKAVDVNSKPEIEFNNNSLTFEYFGISYFKSGKQTYRHRLLGLETEWVINQQTAAQYPYLPAGSYRFEVQVLNADGSWGHESARFSFTILQPYWQKWWFLLLVIGFSIFILLSIFRYIIFQQEKRKRMESEISRFEQEALANQMNPHFLFNALNTIQRYILDNDKLSSSRYLSKFSNLMRQTLNHSQMTRVSLKKEIELLKLYIEMESARFKDRFTFEVNCSPEIDQDKTEIPVFFIQPLVENAIKHGLMNSQEPGVLIVDFKKNNLDLICTVHDNGIGRIAAGRLSSSLDKKSVGLHIIQKRISLINRSGNKSIKLSYEDLYDEMNTPKGTKAKIEFSEVIYTSNKEDE